MIRLAKDGIISFSNKPLELLSALGIFNISSGCIWLLVLIIIALCGVDFGAWQIVVSSMLLLCGILLAAMGVMGEYIGRIYDEAKGRPQFTVAHLYNFDDEQEHDGQK